MSDRKGDPSKQTDECKTGRCPNVKETYSGFDGERYACDVCGKSYFLDYEDMK